MKINIIKQNLHDMLLYANSLDKAGYHKKADNITKMMRFAISETDKNSLQAPNLDEQGHQEWLNNRDEFQQWKVYQENLKEQEAEKQKAQSEWDTLWQSGKKTIAPKKLRSLLEQEYDKYLSTPAPQGDKRTRTPRVKKRLPELMQERGITREHVVQAAINEYYTDRYNKPFYTPKAVIENLLERIVFPGEKIWKNEFVVPKIG